MNDSNRALAYTRIRLGCGFIGVGVVVAYLPVVFALFGRSLAHPLWFLVSIPVAFFVGGHGLAYVAHGIAMLFRSD